MSKVKDFSKLGAEHSPAATQRDLLPGFDQARLTLRPFDFVYSDSIEGPVVGTAPYRYQVLDRFFKRPVTWTFIEVPDVAVDANDNVYLFTRNRQHTIMIFDKRGNFLDEWGDLSDSYFTFAHGIAIGPDGSVYTADSGNHTVRKWTSDGKLLLTLGRPRHNAPEQSGEPFNRPADMSVASNGDIYVADGYGNSHVHCFDSAGQFKFSWGGHGSAPGEFDLPHGVFVDREDGDKVYVADRFNNRVQVFTALGQFLTQWDDFVLPTRVRKGPDGAFCVVELYQRVSVVSPAGKVLARWGDEGVPLVDNEGSRTYYERGLPTSPARKLAAAGFFKGINRSEPGAGLLSCPHGVAVDSEGSIYVAETPETRSGLDRGDRSIQKFVRV